MEKLILMLIFGSSIAVAGPTAPLGRFVFRCEKTVTNTTTGEQTVSVIERKDPNDRRTPFPPNELTDRFFVEMIGGNSKGPTSFSLCDRELEICAAGIGKNNIDMLNLFPKGYEVSFSCSVWNP